MIRPSSLSIAKHCDLAPVLSERYPTTSAATERGNAVDDQVTAFVRDGTPPTDIDAKACVEWICAQWDPTEATLAPQERIRLVDAGEVVTEGTADLLVVLSNDGVGVIVDYKKREQWLAGRLPHPDDNDQLHAYALGALNHYRTCVLLFGSGKVEAIWSQSYSPANTGAILERIKKTCTPPVGEPKGTAGDHCGQCYPRIHCPHWEIRAWQGVQGTIRPSVENGALLYLAAKAMEEKARVLRALCRDLAEQNDGFPVGAQEYRRVVASGSLAVDKEALERDGLLERYSYMTRGSVKYQPCKPRERSDAE